MTRDTEFRVLRVSEADVVRSLAATRLRNRPATF